MRATRAIGWALALLLAGCAGGSGAPDGGRPDAAVDQVGPDGADGAVRDAGDGGADLPAPRDGARDGAPADEVPAPDVPVSDSEDAGRPADAPDGAAPPDVRDAVAPPDADTAAPECARDEDCPEDANPCTWARCADGACGFVAVFGPCDDGDFCTVEDFCADGGCVAGAPRDCDDGDPETVDWCEPLADACSHLVVDDGGWCAGPWDCVTVHGPADPCHQWVCPQGFCREVVVPDGTACEDGLFCSVNDTCRAGVCTAGPPRECCDGAAGDCCTCDEAERRCRWTCSVCGEGCETGADCDDGDPCTTDSCLTFLSPTVCTCRPREACACDPDAPDGGAAECDDGDRGTVEICERNLDPSIPHAGLCGRPSPVCDWPCAGPDDAAACDDGDPCTTDLCEPWLYGDGGCCVQVPPRPGTPCGRPCTTDDHCSDGDPCTADRCRPDGTCDRPEWNTAPCDDGDACTVSDACDEGLCRGEPRDCDDGDGCPDSCDPQQGCVHGPCGPDCRTAPELLCDDLDPCTEDTCDLVGVCHHAEVDGGADTPRCQRFPCGGAAPCDDGNPCTADRCEPAAPDPDGPGPIEPQGACLYTLDAACSIQTPGSAHPLACAAAPDCDPADGQPDGDAAFCRHPTTDCPTAWCDADVGCRFLPTSACLPPGGHAP